MGGGHLSKVLEQHGYNVRSTDLVYRGYGETEPLDFLNAKDAFDGDIVTNPPYKYALEFVRKSLDIVKHGYKKGIVPGLASKDSICMLVKDRLRNQRRV